MVQPFTTDSQYRELPENLTVSSQTRNSVILRTDRCIVQGQTFQFQPEQIVGVAKEDGQTAEISLLSASSVPITSVKRLDTIPFGNVPKPLIAVPPTQLGKLDVECALKDSFPPGSLGWTLTYQSLDNETFDERPIVQYHDYYNRGYCKLNGRGKWGPGIYTLRVTLYDRNRMIPIKLKFRDWTLQESATVLGCGAGCPLPAISFL